MTSFHETFDDLLQQLQARFGGKFHDARSDEDSALAADSLGDFYERRNPFFAATIQGAKIRVEPMSGNRLHIHAYGPMPATFELHPKGIADRLFRLLGLSGAVRSGNRAFDRDFATNINAVDKPQLLRQPEVYLLIRSLTPFAYLKIHEGGVMLECDCEDDKYITVDAVGEVITKLISFLALGARNNG
jgi:hypothetical protein